MNNKIARFVFVTTMNLATVLNKQKLKLEHSLYTLLQIFSLTLFEKMPINELFAENNYDITTPVNDKQLSLFDL